MQIREMKIGNFRNLDGVELTLDPRTSFLIGENELGKSNLLDLLDVLFNRRAFSEEDFSDPRKPIRVEFSLLLSETERGNFEDFFDPACSDAINIVGKQFYAEVNERITFLWKEGEESLVEIPPALFRRVNFVKYDSLRAPREELTFHRGRGVSRFLSYLIQQYASTIEPASNQEYLVEGSISDLTAYVDRILQSIKPFRTHGIGIFTDAANSVDLLGRILKLKGADDLDIQKSGYGVQFSTLVILSILERLIHLKQSPGWEDSVFVGRRTCFSRPEYEDLLERYPDVKDVVEALADWQGEKVSIDIQSMPEQQRSELGEDVIGELTEERHISLVLGLDEPEIHLHPYKQRSLIKYIIDLLGNEDEDFSALLKEMLGVDSVNGQAIVVSHSPNALLDDYRNVVRLYRQEGEVRAVSGSTVQMDEQIEKHLLMNLPYIKEAFFSRCALVVEGETEVGALPKWAAKTIGDPDELGIVVVRARGIESVPPIVRLLDVFRIPNVSVVDRDDSDATRYSEVAGLRTTASRDFEEELFESVYAHDEDVGILFEVLADYGTGGLGRYATRSRLSEIAVKYDIDPTWDTTNPTDRIRFAEITACTDKNLVKAMFLSWLTLSQTKTIALGRLLGEKIPSSLVPEVYRSVIQEAKLKAEQAHGSSD